MLVTLLAVRGWSTPALRNAPVQRTSIVRCDADRCYYGDVDENGNVMMPTKKVLRDGPAPQPSPALSPLDVIDAQFTSLSMGTYTGIEEAYSFVAPSVVSDYGMDLAKFKTVLNGPAFDGLVGCAEWKVLETTQPADDVAVVKLRVLPKPIPGRTSTLRMAAYSDLTTGDRKVIFNQEMGKGLKADPRHTQIPMAAQSFVNEMLTSEGLAMNTPRYRYSRVFGIGLNTLCDIFLSAGIREETAQIVRDNLIVALEFDPKKVYADAEELSKLAEGKSEEEILALPDLKELASKETQYSYILGAGLCSLMKAASVEPSDEAIKRWSAALNIKAVNAFTRDLGYFNMNVQKFADMKEMFAQMAASAKQKEAKDLAEKAEKANAEAEAAEKAAAEKAD